MLIIFLVSFYLVLLHRLPFPSHPEKRRNPSFFHPKMEGTILSYLACFLKNPPHQKKGDFLNILETNLSSGGKKIPVPVNQLYFFGGYKKITNTQ